MVLYHQNGGRSTGFFPAPRVSFFPAPAGAADCRPRSCLPLRGNCGFALPVTEKAKPQLPQRSEKWSKRTREHFSGYRKADGVICRSPARRKKEDKKLRRIRTCGPFTPEFFLIFLCMACNPARSPRSRETGRVMLVFRSAAALAVYIQKDGFPFHRIGTQMPHS